MKNQRNFEEISKRLFPQLENLNNQNPQLIIVFSGIPGSGKSDLSKKLEKKYRAVKIGNDSIRNIIYSSGVFSLSEEKSEELLQNYNEFILRNYPFKNKFLVLDKSMDRQYKRFFPIFEELELRYFLIQMEIPKKEAIKRIIKREKIDSKILQKKMEIWEGQYKKFKKKVKPDILLDSLSPDIDNLYSKIDEKLKRNI